MNTIIIGGKTCGASTLQMLIETISINIVGILIDPEDRELAEIANALNLPIKHDLHSLFDSENIDLIINLSGSEKINAKIYEYKPANAEIVNNATLLLICQLLQNENKKSHNFISELTREHWSLYRIGISLSSAKDLSEVYEIIVQQATALTNTPAGSLAVFDEDSGEMNYVASTGFSQGMAVQRSWKLRAGGLTDFILTQKDPIVITDINEYPDFINPQLASEGIASLVACPLFLDSKVVGIIYVDDFKIRNFTERDISLLSLLSTYAAIAIEKAKLLEEAQMLAITDDLTKLFNHRYLVHQLKIELSRADRYKVPLSLIMIDIDHFKLYNDTNGHLKGNEVLKQLAEILQGESRESDIIARYGGEEFIIICPETSKDNACQLTERLRVKVESHDFTNTQSQHSERITISAGIASYPEDAPSSTELIEKADIALYLAKRTGRNRVCFYLEPGKQSTEAEIRD